MDWPADLTESFDSLHLSAGDVGLILEASDDVPELPVLVVGVMARLRLILDQVEDDDRGVAVPLTRTEMVALYRFLNTIWNGG